MSKKITSCITGVIAFIILVVFDQITKRIVYSNLRDHEPIPIIQDVFELRYLENRGAAFGILQGQRSFFIVITLVILAIIVYCYIRIPVEKRFRVLHVIMVMIAAGAVGNFIDRTMNAYVVDFFYFILIDFPIFNVADVYVTTSVILLIVMILFKYKDADMSVISASLKLKNKGIEK